MTENESQVNETDGQVGTKEQTETNTYHIPMYKVIMHDDDKTTQQFVVWVLQTIFMKEAKEAIKVMYTVHETGQALVGVYPFEHAEMRVDQTHSVARAKKFPLKCTIEEA